MSWHYNLMGHPHFLGYLSCVGGPDMDLDLHSSIFITKFVLQTQPGGYSQSWQSVHRWGMFLRRSQGLRQDCSQGPWGSWFASWALSCHCGSCSPTLRSEAEDVVMFEAHWHLTTHWLLSRMSSLYTLLTMRPGIYIQNIISVLDQFPFDQSLCSHSQNLKKGRKKYHWLNIYPQAQYLAILYMLKLTAYLAAQSVSLT